MLPVDRTIAPDSEPLPATDGTPGGREDLLERALQVCRMWLQHLPAHDPRRENLDAMAILVKDIIESGDYSLRDAMTTARALLCTNCRRLNAAPEQCAGRSLDRCPLVKGIGS
jgi:hypothetical protein